MIAPERVEALQAGWVRLLAGFGVEPAAAYPVFDRLAAAYSEPHRHYHTLEHVAEMLKVVGRLARHTADPAAVQLAVWFHDAVYDPRAADNEERSAALADEELQRLNLPVNLRRAVRSLILGTKHAAVPPDPTPAGAAVLDADLAILAATEPRYHRYADDIRKEFEHVPDEQYRAGRAAVLDRFLARPRIFLTEAMFLEGEAAARRNITLELRRLRGG